MAGRPGLDGGAEPDPEFGSGVPKAPLVCVHTPDLRKSSGPPMLGKVLGLPGADVRAVGRPGAASDATACLVPSLQSEAGAVLNSETWGGRCGEPGKLGGEPPCGGSTDPQVRSLAAPAVRVAPLTGVPTGTSCVVGNVVRVGSGGGEQRPVAGRRCDFDGV